MDELGESLVWREAMELVVIKTFLETHRDVFDLERRQRYDEAQIDHAQQRKNQRSAAGSPSSITNNGDWRRSGQVHWDTSVVCLSTLKVLPKVRVHPLGPSHRVRWHTQNVLKKQKIQHLMCGRRLQDVAASLGQGAGQPSEMPMIGIVRHEMKWYSRNNRRLWCFKEAQSGSGGGPVCI